MNGVFGSASFTIGAAFGEDTGTAILPLADVADDERWWAVSGGFVFGGFATDVKLQLSGAYAQNLGNEDCQFENCDEELEFIDAEVSLFWEPVDQLTLGIGVGWHSLENRELRTG